MRLLLMLVILSSIFSSEIIWKNGPTELLKEVFKITKVKESDDLECLISQTSSKWVRPTFMESWHAYSFLNKGQKKELVKLFENPDFAKERLPKQTHYDAVIIMGFNPQRLQKRINFLIKLHNQGITFGNIYLLGTSNDLKIGGPIEEKMKIEYLWYHTPKPDALNHVKVTALMVCRNTSGFDATSNDLVMKMAAQKDVKEKNFLLISSDSYILNQDAGVKKVLDAYGVTLETVCPAMQGESPDSVLKNIAKCLQHLRR
ncbi:MAG: hypothetical protein NT128_04385 [Proteobacteria bacterium]|nr:hypothetical protein [Pseudomonadota bacterium]